MFSISMYSGTAYDLFVYYYNRSGQLAVVKYLACEAGCDKEAIDKDGDTALHMVAK